MTFYHFINFFQACLTASLYLLELSKKIPTKAKVSYIPKTLELITNLDPEIKAEASSFRKRFDE